MKSVSNETLNFFLQKVLGLLHFGSCQNCKSSGEPCTCEYITLLQSFHRGTLSIHWYIAQNFQPTFSMSILFRGSVKTAIFSRFLKVAIATSNFMNEVYNGGFNIHIFIDAHIHMKDFIFRFHIYFSASFAFYSLVSDT